MRSKEIVKGLINLALKAVKTASEVPMSMLPLLKVLTTCYSSRY